MTSSGHLQDMAMAGCCSTSKESLDKLPHYPNNIVKRWWRSQTCLMGRVHRDFKLSFLPRLLLLCFAPPLCFAHGCGFDSPATRPSCEEAPGIPGSDQFRIIGGNRLEGTITISGSKNAALPMMCACLLTDLPIELLNVPTLLSDMKALAEILRGLGPSVEFLGSSSTVLHAKDITSNKVDYGLARKFRASVLLLGPLLARHGSAEVPLPGGCVIGARPVDFHLQGLKAMGATIEIDGGLIRATAPDGLKGAVLDFPRVSVGATANIMMAACLANGTTTLINVAQEPEIVNLGQLLINMGASIKGLGTPRIVIQGKAQLHGAVHSVIPDRLETATWMVACCLTRGTLNLQNIKLDHLTAVLEPLQKAGLHIQEGTSGVTVHRPTRPGCILSGTNITTEPYPGFPTDLQAPFMTLLTLCGDTNTITETMFENRFMHVRELHKFGAKIHALGNSASVEGVSRLKGCEVLAPDLRGGAALVLAALAAEGETRINGVHHINRGYENMVEKLKACGASIERIQCMQ